MSLAAFLQQLFETGEVSIRPGIRPEPDADAVLTEADRIHRETLAFTAPALCLQTASWAGVIYYHTCEFIVNRDAAPEAAGQFLRVKPPLPHSHSVDYSADLVFQYLPDAFRLAQGIAKDDPLNQILHELLRDWPLSSPGTGVPAETASTDLFWDQPSLRTLYVDRVMKQYDFARAEDPRVAAEIKAAIGNYPEIASRWSDHLRKQ